MPQSIAIVGAGVSGLTCGILLAERGERVSIFAEETGQHTTSAAAAAIWYPYDAEPAGKVIPWALETYQVFAGLAPDARSGVSMIELRTFSRTGQIQIPEWALPLGARPLAMSSEVETSLMGTSAVFKSGFTLNVPLTDTTLYLDYLATRFQAAGGSIASKMRLEELEAVDPSFGLVINCAGIGARALVPDLDLEPHRGQVVLVPKIDQLSGAIVCDDAPLIYAIPRTNDCLFGGTNEVSEDRRIDAAATERILAECSRVLNIERPAVLAERVGLRPFRRSGIRLEAGKLRDGRTVIHNYGHGGAGFTLSWGCANQVLDIAGNQAGRDRF